MARIRDAELWRKACDGDRDALADLLMRMRKKLTPYVKAEVEGDWEDVLQKLMLRLMLCYKNHVPSDDHTFKSYSKAILKNIIAKHLGSKSDRPYSDDFDIDHARGDQGLIDIDDEPLTIEEFKALHHLDKETG